MRFSFRVRKKIKLVSADVGNAFADYNLFNRIGGICHHQAVVPHCAGAGEGEGFGHFVVAPGDVVADFIAKLLKFDVNVNVGFGGTADCKSRRAYLAFVFNGCAATAEDERIAERRNKCVIFNRRVARVIGYAFAVNGKHKLFEAIADVRAGICAYAEVAVFVRALFHGVRNADNIFILPLYGCSKVFNVGSDIELNALLNAVVDCGVAFPAFAEGHFLRGFFLGQCNVDNLVRSPASERLIADFGYAFGNIYLFK